jgi:hypothetical protein
MSAKKGGRCLGSNQGSGLEMGYGNSRLRQQADAAGERRQRRFRSTGSITHLARAIVVLLVLMHRASSPGRQRAIARLSGVRRRDAPQPEGRRDNAGTLAEQPAADQPNKMTSEAVHRR